MSETFFTFQKFNDPVLAAAICAQLQAEGIPCMVVKEAPVFDVSFANNDFEPTTHLKLATADFSRAHTALEKYYQSQLSSMDPDYYLFFFTDAELLEIVRKPDEWGHLDYALAKKLLDEHGIGVTPALIEEYRQQRIVELSQTETTHPLLIFFGYFSAVFGGLIGFLLGYILTHLKKTLPTGERRYIYPLEERKHGKRMLVISAISFPCWLIFSIMTHRNIFPWLRPF